MVWLNNRRPWHDLWTSVISEESRNGDGITPADTLPSGNIGERKNGTNERRRSDFRDSIGQTKQYKQSYPAASILYSSRKGRMTLKLIQISSGLPFSKQARGHFFPSFRGLRGSLSGSYRGDTRCWPPT